MNNVLDDPVHVHHRSGRLETVEEFVRIQRFHLISFVLPCESVLQIVRDDRLNTSIAQNLPIN